MKNHVIELFMKALDEILTTNEVDLIIKDSSGKERQNLKWLKEEYASAKKEFDTLPIWMILPHIKSAMLFQDIIAYMIGYGVEERRNEEAGDEN